MHSQKLNNVIKDCYKVAERACTEVKETLTTLTPEFKRFKSDLNDKLQNLERHEESKKYPFLQVVKSCYNEICVQADEKFNELYERLDIKSHHLKDYTVAIFGATKVGKSTLMETITMGDGYTIGKGAQRTSKDIRDYQWNHLRIVDTPGFAAYQGKEDERLALDAIDSSDLIIFMGTDDGFQLDEFEKMHTLLKQTKPFIFALNVKENLYDDKRLNRFIKNPHRLFDSEHLKGLEDRINESVQRFFSDCKVNIIPIQALAAWLSTQKDYSNVKKELRESSRLENLEKALHNEIQTFGKVRRIQTFFISATFYLEEFKDVLSNNIKDIKEQSTLVYEKREKLQKMFGNFIDQKNREIKETVNELFESRISEVPKFVEEYIFKEKAEIKQQLNKLINEKELKKDLEDFAIKITSEYNYSIMAFFKEFKYDYERFFKDDFPGASKMDPETSGSVLGITSAALYAVATGIFVLGLENFWNPIGWGLLVASMITGIIGLFQNDNAENQRKKREEASKLQAKIREAETNTYNEFMKWFNNSIVKHYESLRQQLDDFYKTLSEFHDITNNFRDMLVSPLIGKLNTEMFSNVIELLHPISKLHINIIKCERIPGEKTTLIIDGGSFDPVSLRAKLSEVFAEEIRILETVKSDDYS